MKKLIILAVALLMVAAFMVPAFVAARESPNDMMLAPAATIVIPTTPVTTFTANRIESKIGTNHLNYGRYIHLPGENLTLTTGGSMVSTNPLYLLVPVAFRDAMKSNLATEQRSDVHNRLNRLTNMYMMQESIITDQTL